MSAISSLQAGKQEKSIREANARILEAEAVRERRAMGEQAREKRKEGQRLVKRQRVLYAKGNVKTTVGTPLLVRDETIRRIEQQASIIQEHGQFAYETKRNRAAIERKIGRAAKKRSKWEAGSSLATGLGSALLLTA
jgi:hypothetical protein